MARESGNTQSFSKIVVLLAFTMLLPCAQASILSNGLSVPPSPVDPLGPVIATAAGTIAAGAGSSHFSVDFTEQVFQDPSNIMCAGCLDFVYVFTNHGPDVNERYSMSSFAGFTLNVGTSPFGIHDPTTIDRSNSGNGPNVGFNFPASDEILAGQTTVSLVIQTNATTFVPGTVTAQDGTAGSSAAALAPAPAVIPEPGSLVLMGSGLVAVGGFLRKLRFGKRS